MNILDTFLSFPLWVRKLITVFTIIPAAVALAYEGLGDEFVSTIMLYWVAVILFCWVYGSFPKKEKAAPKEPDRGWTGHIANILDTLEDQGDAIESHTERLNKLTRRIERLEKIGKNAVD